MEQARRGGKVIWRIEVQSGRKRLRKSDIRNGKGTSACEKEKKCIHVSNIGREWGNQRNRKLAKEGGEGWGYGGERKPRMR